MSQWYVLLDPLKIHSYVFATNKLSIIIGSSLELARWQENCNTWSKKARGRCLTTGGGNVLAEFPGKTEAETFKNQALQGRPPGLEIAWALEQDAGKQDGEVWAALQLKISCYKAGDREPADYPTTAPPTKTDCRYCGLRQADGGGAIDGRKICKECRKLHDSGAGLHKTHAGGTPVERLYQAVEQADFTGCFPNELEELVGRKDKDKALAEGKGEADFLAVVVIDLNDLGRRMEQTVNSGGFSALENFSSCLAQKLDEVCKKLVLQLANCDQGWNLYESGTDKGKRFVRFRPLLLAGDDIVVALPAPLWPDFVEQALTLLKNAGFPACAGVVVAKHNFPINRLAEMAEELVAHAKKLVRFKKEGSLESRECALDWVVHQESAFTSPLEARRRDFLKELSSHYELATQRPYTLEEFKQLRWRMDHLKNISNRKLFSLYRGLRQGTQTTRDTLVYTFFRDESEDLGRYAPLWQLVEEIPGEFPLWEKHTFTKGGAAAILHDTWVPDLLELKFTIED